MAEVDVDLVAGALALALSGARAWHGPNPPAGVWPPPGVNPGVLPEMSL